MRRSSLRLVVPALLALAACDGGTDPPGPAGGDYDAVLQSPHGPEAAAVVELNGAGIEDVQSATAFLQSGTVSGGRRVVLVRRQPGTLEFRVRMAEGREPPDARIVEVAGPDDELRPSLARYRVTFTRVAAP